MTRAVRLAPWMALAALVASPVLAQSPAICAPTDQVDDHRLLRQLTLDLYGRIPTVEEHARLDEVGVGGVLDAMFASEELFAELRRYHRALLLGTLDGVSDIVDRRRVLRPRVASGIWSIPAMSVRYRGERVDCVNQRQTRFDEAGRPVPIVGTQEGWVYVNPYWAPSTRIRVCAFDAQTADRGLRASCDEVAGVTDPGCGCGEGLERCVSRGRSDATIRQSLVEEPARIFDAVVRGRRPYVEALTTRTTYVNGPTSFFYRGFVGRGAVKDPLPELPELSFDDVDTWLPVERPQPHSGVLTTFGFLMRFASNRGRANHFYASLLCQPFDPPEADLPPATDPCSDEPDLSRRCGCAACHSTLEPTAAHWGRFRHTTEFGHLRRGTHPDFSAQCAECADGECDAECNSYYVTADNASHPDELALRGTLQALAFRSEAEREAPTQGPRRLVAAAGDDALARCTARRLAEHLLGRTLTDEELLDWLPELAAFFVEADQDFLSLLRRLVEDPRYRAIR